jgi:transcription elongation factor Elf1
MLHFPSNLLAGEIKMPDSEVVKIDKASINFTCLCNNNWGITIVTKQTQVETIYCAMCGRGYNITISVTLRGDPECPTEK